MTLPNLPRVSVIVPIRNEQKHIERCLRGLLAQTYPHSLMEIWVADGMSSDGTREIVQRLIKDAEAPTAQRLTPKNPTATEGLALAPGRRQSDQTALFHFEMLDNPEQIVPTALNRGIRAASGAVIVRVDGHTVIAADYVARCVHALAETQADDVGGTMRALGESYIGQSIVLATSSAFGVGGARFHYAEKAAWVDTVYLGAYPRGVFERVGFFDEELVRNQDDEFNFRLTLSGGRIWLDPEIHSTYYSRESVRALWKQYFEYGFWKVRVIQKHGRPAAWRHLIPMVFVLALLATAALSLLTHTLLWSVLIAVPYALAALLASMLVAHRHGWRYLPILPLAFATMHLAYGFGFLVGLAHFGLKRRKAVPRMI